MTRETPTSGAVRRRIRTELVDVLTRSALVRDDSGRQLLMDELHDQLGELDIRRQDRHRLLVAEIVRACAARPDGLDVLVTTVAQLEPETTEVIQLQRLRDEWEAVELLLPADWTELRPALSTASPAALALLCQQATGHRLAGPPVWCTNAWEVFVHLAGRNADTDAVPPGLLFLDLLANELDDVLAGQIRRRNQEQVRALGLTAALAGRRAEIEGGPDQHGAAIAYLVVQIEPDLEPSQADRDGAEGYWVSHYRQWRGAGIWHSQWGLRELVEADGLEAAVETIIDFTEAEWSDRPGTMAVEFVLPWELLNAEVEWWRKETSSTRPTVLAMDYPIVVRSLERLRTRRWHRLWHQRWDQLRRSPSSSTVRVSRPAGKDYLTRLERDLKVDDRIVSLVLSEPPVAPGSIGQQEVEAAMRAGLPVVIWHRSDCTTDAFREAVTELTSDGALAELPLRLKRFRLEALGQEPEQRDEHVGRHLTVLWDDPERKPDPLGSPSGQRQRGSYW